MHLKNILRLKRRITEMSLFRHIHKAEIGIAASSLAYTTMLSIVPILAISLSIFKAVGGFERVMRKIQPFLLQNLVVGLTSENLLAIQNILSQIRIKTLGITGFAGLTLTSFATVIAASSFMDRLWDVRERTHYKYTVLKQFFVLSLLPLNIGAMAVWIGVFKILPPWWMVFALFFIYLFCFFKFIPQKKVEFYSALISALSTSLVWFSAKLIYKIYINKFLNYNKLYGSLAAFPILLFWVYISWYIIFLGAALGRWYQESFEYTGNFTWRKREHITKSA